uniref:protein NRT1/ PTR FAMILY 2.8-like n=1 Tax=Fragaria vesca subsp. vesca TaxID=101020 RepID=UPI0005C9E470|nr:PREDICTED: protein NRT1/ PTR FAMILY 2.8-like [Fragaria vesca subsp. vesca]
MDEKDEKAAVTNSDEPEVKYSGIKAMPFVIGNETFEKLGTLGTSSNLLVYLTTVFNMKSITATNLVNIFNGTINVRSFFPTRLDEHNLHARTCYMDLDLREDLPPSSQKFSRSSQTDLRFTMTQRINTGIVLSVVTMVVSGIVEEHRRKSALKHGLFVSPTSFALLLPQYFLTGLTEAFSAVAIMEFFTMQMPESMRTVAGAIFFLSLSVSNYLGSFVANMVHKATEGKSPWVGGHDLNKNKLDCYYYIIAALGAVNFVYFNLFARHYVLVSKKPGSDNGKGEVQLENPNPIARDSSNEESKA